MSLARRRYQRIYITEIQVFAVHTNGPNALGRPIRSGHALRRDTAEQSHGTAHVLLWFRYTDRNDLPVCPARFVTFQAPRRKAYVTLA